MTGRRRTSRLVSIVGLALAFMFGSVMLVNLIPNERLAKHLGFSASRSDYEASQFGFGNLDYWGECVGMSVGAGGHATRLTVVNRSLLSPAARGCGGLPKYLEGELSESQLYWRYWHGYQIFARPLLFSTGLTRVHYLLLAALVWAAAFFAYQALRVGVHCAAAFLVACFCVPLIEQASIITHSMVWVLSFLAGALILGDAGRSRARRQECLLLSGMLCCFFDLFTVPLVSLTVPLVALYWRGCHCREEHPLTAGEVCVLSGFWLGGFSICWAAKWAAVSLFTDTPVFSDLVSVIRHRLVHPIGDDGRPLDVTAVRSVVLNASVCWYGWAAIAGLAVVRARTLITRIPHLWRNPGDLATPVLLLALPLLWLAIVQQHSIWHSWFVARIYFSTFALLATTILAPSSRRVARSSAIA
ncbi:MAG: hypothetical protein U0Q16_21530 [Bryobacteraceae bacterium]